MQAKNNEVVKSVSGDQSQILKWILKLNNLESFEADCTYGNGGFYKDIPEPFLKFDYTPLSRLVRKACATNLPLSPESLRSLVFDPPFLTYIKSGREHNSIMAKRFSGFWSYNDLSLFYIESIKEAARVLKPRGIYVVKCQDIIHNHKMHCTHANVIDWASPMFRLKDLFILTAQHRIPVGGNRTQQHARIYHSYFLVFEKLRKKIWGDTTLDK